MKNLVKKKITYLLVGGMVLGPLACKDEFLEIPVTGQLSEVQVSTQAGMEGLLIGTYSVINGRGNGWFSGATNWLWGSIRGGEANKGSDAGDFNTMTPNQVFTTLEPVNPEPNGKWRGSYEGVTRANNLLGFLNRAEGVPQSAIDRMRAEAHFRKTFGRVPWIDETLTDLQEIVRTPNNTDIYPQIEADFRYAWENLPETQAQIGRANKWAAGAYLGKVLLYQQKFAEAKVILDQVIASGTTSDGRRYGLVPSFPALFRGENENSEESVFAFQAAANTGSVDNTNHDIAMNYPYNTGPNGPGECCGFYAPSFDLANSYRTANGLPLLDNSYRLPANELRTDMGIASTAAFTPDPGPVDPRLDYTIGRRGIPFLDWGPHPGFAWIRDQRFAGPYTQKKFSYERAERGRFQDGSSWTPSYHSINFMIIRFADVLLMAAECDIELGNLETARAYVNQIRARAANADAFVTQDDGTPAANYQISLYEQPWTDPNVARQALRFERKLELGLEGHRFFDLVRWGIAEQEINAIIAFEQARLPINYQQARFTTGRDEYLPIPQFQIDLMPEQGILTQNPGY
jgi:starch-binding outer membrane protein, SusD/RagB family